jgi:hypothetical protein
LGLPLQTVCSFKAISSSGFPYTIPPRNPFPIGSAFSQVVPDGWRYHNFRGWAVWAKDADVYNSNSRSQLFFIGRGNLFAYEFNSKTSYNRILISANKKAAAMLQLPFT